METVNQVKEALSARSRTATLEELANQGRKRVRLIKAEHVAAMISAAVHTAIENSNYVPKEEADRLVQRSREEFRSLIKDREAEARRVVDLEERLAQREAELDALRAELEALRAGSAGGTDGAGTAGQGAAQAAAGAAAAAGAPAPGTPVSPDLSAALDKLAGSLNERLEQLGRKMGISSAVEGDEVNLDGLFKDQDTNLESNMENIQVKKKAGGGIAANLARLKKLKGGG